MKVTRGLVTAAIRIAADASTRKTGSDNRHVSAQLVDDLRRELDASGLGEDWRTLHALPRTRRPVYLTRIP